MVVGDKWGLGVSAGMANVSVTSSSRFQSTFFTLRNFESQRVENVHKTLTLNGNAFN